MFYTIFGPRKRQVLLVMQAFHFSGFKNLAWAVTNLSSTSCTECMFSAIEPVAAWRVDFSPVMYFFMLNGACISHGISLNKI